MTFFDVNIDRLDGFFADSPIDWVVCVLGDKQDRYRPFSAFADKQAALDHARAVVKNGQYRDSFVHEVKR